MSISTRLRAVSALGFAAALCCAACSYDLDRLRGRHDAQVDDAFDATADDATDVTPPDDGADVEDSAPADVPVDTGPACMDPAVLDVSALGSRFGNTWRITNDTSGGPSVLTPPCSSTGGTPTSEKVYRYVVQQGPRLYATTDSLAACGGSFDTILYALGSCTDASTSLDCNDDDHVLSQCGTMAGYTSSILLDGLRAGQSVYLVVDGYNGHTGPFRLSVTENGVQNAAPPATGITNTRCMCPGGLDNTVQTLPFPAPSDAMVSQIGATITSLTRPGDRLRGTHMIPTLSMVAGASLEFTLTQNTLTCTTGVATIDLLVDSAAVQSFEIDSHAPPLTALHVSYTTFGTMTLLANPTTIELRLRSVGDCTGGVVFSRNGTLTLVGR